MPKWISALCLLATPLTVLAADKPFKSYSVRKAKESYDAAVAKAKADYIAELEKGIKEYGGKGDLAEANRIAEEKKAIQTSGQTLDGSAREKLRKRLLGTSWTFAKEKVTVRFLPKDFATNNHGHKAIWIAVDKDTVVQQMVDSGTIGIWKFSKDLKNAVRFSFIRQDDRKWMAVRN